MSELEPFELEIGTDGFSAAGTTSWVNAAIKSAFLFSFAAAISCDVKMIYIF
jgi:hypothetical protein